MRRRLLFDSEVEPEEGYIDEFDFTGDIQETVLTPGKYFIQCWGASSNSFGGGYSEGFYNVTKTTPVYVYVGGTGHISGDAVGGWNGGGSGPGRNLNNDISYTGGSGASDICTVKGLITPDSKNPYIYSRPIQSLESRFIVAGGSGGTAQKAGTPGTTQTVSVGYWELRDVKFLGESGWTIESDKVVCYVAVPCKDSEKLDLTLCSYFGDQQFPYNNITSVLTQEELTFPKELANYITPYSNVKVTLDKQGTDTTKLGNIIVGYIKMYQQKYTHDPDNYITYKADTLYLRGKWIYQGGNRTYLQAQINLQEGWNEIRFINENSNMKWESIRLSSSRGMYEITPDTTTINIQVANSSVDLYNVYVLVEGTAEDIEASKNHSLGKLDIYRRAKATTRYTPGITTESAAGGPGGGYITPSMFSYDITGSNCTVKDPELWCGQGFDNTDYRYYSPPGGGGYYGGAAAYGDISFARDYSNGGTGYIGSTQDIQLIDGFSIPGSVCLPFSHKISDNSSSSVSNTRSYDGKVRITRFNIDDTLPDQDHGNLEFEMLEGSQNYEIIPLEEGCIKLQHKGNSRTCKFRVTFKSTPTLAHVYFVYQYKAESSSYYAPSLSDYLGYQEASNYKSSYYYGKESYRITGTYTIYDAQDNPIQNNLYITCGASVTTQGIEILPYQSYGDNRIFYVDFDITSDSDDNIMIAISE